MISNAYAFNATRATATASFLDSSTTRSCPCCGHALGNTTHTPGFPLHFVTRPSPSPQPQRSKASPWQQLLEALDDVDVARATFLEIVRRRYRVLVRARRRNLPLLLRPCPPPASRTRPSPRRRARGEPLGIRNFHRQESR